MGCDDKLKQGGRVRHEISCSRFALVIEKLYKEVFKTPTVALSVIFPMNKSDVRRALKWLQRTNIRRTFKVTQ